MTTVVAIRVPTHGAVMVADGKISDDSGRIWSTTARKLLQLNAATVGVAGNLVVLDELKRAQPHTATEVKEFLRDSAFVSPYELVCYDRINDLLWSFDQNGMYVEYPFWVAIGIGGQIASGALMMSSPPTGLDDAVVLGRQAVKASAALNGFCGGVSHWQVCERVQSEGRTTARRKIPPIEFHGTIAAYDDATRTGVVKIGKRIFDFSGTSFNGGRPPAPKMKVAVDISATGAVLSLRPRKS